MRLVAALLLLALAALPHAGAAQPSRPTPRVGVLLLATSTSGSGATFLDAFRASLRDLGWVDGRSIELDVRSAEGRAERLPGLAAELVDRKVDVIVTGGGNVSTLAARQATATVPIVMVGSVSAVESGLVASLARPGGNVTGLTVPQEIGLKQIELLRELVPSLSRLVVLIRTGVPPAAQQTQSKARALEFLRLTLEYVEVEQPAELAKGLAKVRAIRPHAMIVGPSPLFAHAQDEVVQFARTARIPAIYPFRDFVDAGGLMSYSFRMKETSVGVARYVDRILKGAKPAELPVEEPTMYELVVNRRTARAMQLTVPPGLLLRADHILD